MSNKSVANRHTLTGLIAKSSATAELKNSVVGLPPHSGGVAHALGSWQWTNNSTGLLDMK